MRSLYAAATQPTSVKSVSILTDYLSVFTAAGAAIVAFTLAWLAWKWRKRSVNIDQWNDIVKTSEQNRIENERLTEQVSYTHELETEYSSLRQAISSRDARILALQDNLSSLKLKNEELVKMSAGAAKKKMSSGDNKYLQTESDEIDLREIAKSKSYEEPKSAPTDLRRLKARADASALLAAELRGELDAERNRRQSLERQLAQHRPETVKPEPDRSRT